MPAGNASHAELSLDPAVLRGPYRSMSLWILVAVFATSTLSGMFGMGGGMLLMAAYLALLPGPAALVLHGLTQLVANGTRAVSLRRHVLPAVAARYLIGVVVASLSCAVLGLVADGRMMSIGLGLLPFVSLLLPRRQLRFDLTRAWPVALAGAAAGAAQLVAGVAGPVLDLLFARSTLGRHAVVGTKAAIQVSMHAVKVAYVFLLAREAAWDPSIPVGLLLPIALAAALGTRLGGLLLDRMGDASFRVHANRLLLVIGAILIARGVSP